MFIGLSNKKKAIPFGISIFTDEKISTMKTIFDEFFNIIGIKSRYSTIVSNQHKPISVALRELEEESKFFGEHCWDKYHVLISLSKKFKDETVMAHLKQILKTPDKE